MLKHTHFVIFAFLGILLFSSCSQQKMLLKPTASIDTLHLELDLRLIQQYEYKQALLQKKMCQFVTPCYTPNTCPALAAIPHIFGTTE